MCYFKLHCWNDPCCCLLSHENKPQLLGWYLPRPVLPLLSHPGLKQSCKPALWLSLYLFLSAVLAKQYSSFTGFGDTAQGAMLVTYVRTQYLNNDYYKEQM